MSRPSLAVLATHPIQYYSPWFAHMATDVDLHVYYAYRQTPEGQAAAGFSTAFDWDLPLLDGYESTFLNNVAKLKNKLIRWSHFYSIQNTLAFVIIISSPWPLITAILALSHFH